MLDARAVPVGPPTRTEAFLGRRRDLDYQVLVEFEEWVTEADLVTDLGQNPLHGLHHHRPGVTHGRDGHTELRLTVAGPDVWTSTLMAMVLVRQAGYEPRAVHVVVAAVQRRDAA